MFIYSHRIVQFSREIKDTIRTLLTKEIRLECTSNRFYNKKRTASYPIHVVIYNNKPMLGYFDADFYELGFHESLMHASREQVRDIIRHELVHYVLFINEGATTQPHGAKFKEFCRQMGWGESVSKASMHLEMKAGDPEESAVFRKVQKLMALTTSSHANEAEQAMIKSQQLLLKHNLSSAHVGSPESEKVYMKRIMKQKRETAKMRAIAKILETFFVSIVYNRAGGFSNLEILGSKVNVEIAEYVASVLDTELESLWCTAKGALAKNSFFLGVAKGYCQKVKALKEECSSDTINALMVLEKKLVDARAMVYPRLSSKRSSASHCPTSAALGEKMGRQLNINPAIQKRSDASVAHIAHQK